LHLRTIDMAKLGQLFLQDGGWNGQRCCHPMGLVVAITSTVSQGSQQRDQAMQLIFQAA
jgi:hypothetical protein